MNQRRNGVSTETSTLYTYEPFNDFLVVDYEQQGDQWLDALGNALQQKIPNASGRGLSSKQASAEFQYPHLELVIRETKASTSVPADTPTLKIVPLTQQDGTKALYVVLAAKRPINDEDKKVWTECLNEATAKLEEANPEFEWAAVLGQANDPRHQKYSLKRKFTVGDVTARSGGRQYSDDHLSSSPPHFNSRSFAISWPIVIEGKSKGYDWSVASRQAGIDTHKIAVLLSLAWNSTWYLLQSPIPASHGALKIPPTSPFGSPLMGKRRQPHFPQPRTPKIAPKWALKAWDTLDKDSDIDAATTAYYQGLMMEEKHPSFALIAFIASIEIIGKKIVGEKCVCCGKRTGSNQAFRAGVSAVVSDKRKAKELYLLYESRSGTAHDGELHANEEVLGYLSFPSMFTQDSKSMFVFTDLQKAKAVSRKLLIAALKGKLKYAK